MEVYTHSLEHILLFHKLITQKIKTIIWHVSLKNINTIMKKESNYIISCDIFDIQ